MLPLFYSTVLVAPEDVFTAFKRVLCNFTFVSITLQFVYKWKKNTFRFVFLRISSYLCTTIYGRARRCRPHRAKSKTKQYQKEHEETIHYSFAGSTDAYDGTGTAVVKPRQVPWKHHDPLQCGCRKRSGTVLQALEPDHL